MQRKSQAKRLYTSNAFCTVSSSFLGIVIMLLCIFIFSILMTKVDIDDKYVSLMSTVALCVGAYTGGYIASKFKKKNGLIMGLVTGLIIYFLIFLLAVIFAKINISFGIITKLIITVICATVGGIIGVNSKHRWY